MRLVEQQELNVGEIAAVLQLPQSTTSRHLKLLSDDGWLNSRREGTSRLYQLSMDRLPAKQAQLWTLMRESSPHTERDDERLEAVLIQRQTQSQAFFATAAGQWDRVRAEMFGQHIDQQVLTALLSPTQTVADLGCGTGRLGETLAPFIGRVIGVDASDAMIQAARERLGRFDNVELQRAQLDNLPIAAGIADVALMAFVLHYVSRPAAALKEARRILKPGGRLVIVDLQPHAREDYRNHMGHLWLGFSEAQLEEWLGQAGLDGLRYVALASDPASKGPPLFACNATVPTTLSNDSQAA